MRAQPTLAVIAPADHEQAASALRACWDLPGPAYFRLGKEERNVVPGLGGRFATGRAEIVREGGDLVICTTGAIASEAVAAAELLATEGMGCTVMVVAGLSPAPSDDLAATLGSFQTVLTVEAHSVTGGLGSLVSEVVAERGLGCRVVRCGAAGHSATAAGGSESYLNEAHGISRAGLVRMARDVAGR
jgi:transketolase